MYCPFCGTKLEDNSIFCTDCGKRVNEPQANAPQTTNISETNTPAPAPEPTPTPTVQTPAPTPAAQPAPVQRPVATVTPASVPKAAPTAPTAPKAAPIATPKPAPVPKPVKTKKERKPVAINKKAIVTVILAIVLTLVYAVIAFIPFALMGREDAVIVTTVYDDDVYGYFTLNGFLDLLMNGNKMFNPTAISLAFGIGVYALMYAVPVFAGISLIASYVNKKSAPLHVLSSIMTVLYSAVTAAVVPLSMWLIPNFKEAVAVSLKFIIGDVGNLSSTVLIIAAAIMLVLVVISSILVGILKKRRAK